MQQQIRPTWLESELVQFLEGALHEDLQGGDVTAWSVIPEEQKARAVAYAKADLVVCGLPVAAKIFQMLDPACEWKILSKEGERVTSGTKIFSVEGEVHQLLAAERLALNFMQHMSGIATSASLYADAVSGLGVRVVDTRKTLPGLRMFQRYAVRVGGCWNHRNHLGSGILIKENHIRAAGSIKKSIQRVQVNAPHTLRIEIEVTDLNEFEQAVSAGADIVMLDNMSLSDMRKAVDTAPSGVLLEASGGITLETIRGVAETGVDIISVGALTHSIKAADISLLIEDY